MIPQKRNLMKAASLHNLPAQFWNNNILRLWWHPIQSLMRRRDIFGNFQNKRFWPPGVGAASHIGKRRHYLLYFRIVGDISLQLNPKEKQNSALQNPRDVTPSAHLAALHKAKRLRKLEDAAFLERTMAESEGWGIESGGARPKAHSEERLMAPVLFQEGRKNISRIRYNRVDKVTNDAVPRWHFTWNPEGSESEFMLVTVLR